MWLILILVMPWTRLLGWRVVWLVSGFPCSHYTFYLLTAWDPDLFPCMSNALNVIAYTISLLSSLSRPLLPCPEEVLYLVSPANIKTFLFLF
jgi:hypothetical protein